MALGGGTFVLQNKKMPGAYINFVSAAAASASLSDRGYGTMPVELDWGPDGEVFTVTNGDFQKKCLETFGYAYSADAMKPFRDLFKYAQTMYFYRLNTGSKAQNDFAEARWSGIRGNELSVAIAVNADDETLFDVATYIGTTKVDEQTVANAAALADNDFLIWKDSAELSETSRASLSGGSNGSADGAAHSRYLELIEGYSFNVIGTAVTDEATKGLYAAFTRRMRDQVGRKFQCVLYDYPSADYMGVISVMNNTTDTGYPASSAVYWVTGAEAGCAVNRTLQNRAYDGEFAINTNYTQLQLDAAVDAGKFAFHKVGDDVRVLLDINTKVTVSDTEGDVFKENQTVRVCDQIANDIAAMFNTRYLGTVPNDTAGRLSLWSDIVKHHKQLADIRAIDDFADEDVVVSAGSSKKSVVVEDAITVVNAMDKLYMTVTVA